jgi:hypothetical protein
MNHHPPTQTSAASELRIMEAVKNYARREPVKSIALAVGVGLLIDLLPAKAVLGMALAAGAAIMRPVLLSLGATKAMELCAQPASDLGSQ